MAMTLFPYYTAGTTRPQAPAKLPAPAAAEWIRPELYRPDDGLVDAANVALLLGRPLLLTGEPGTGKTEFAYHLAWRLGQAEPLFFATKSTSAAADLFYTYNALSRFHAAQARQGSRDTLDYLTFNALGLAMLYTHDPAELAAWLKPGAVRDPRPGYLHAKACRSVVLIDEVDKAPRDFANDILNEVERMFFRIPELGNGEVMAAPALRPILVLTSNSEKTLPDAFLRRCVYYDIPFPTDERLALIVEAHLGKFSAASETFLADALDLFGQLRREGTALRLSKRPATAELLNWLRAVRAVDPGDGNPLRGEADAVRGVVRRTLSTLVKHAEDRGRAEEIVSQWLSQRPKANPPAERAAGGLPGGAAAGRLPRRHRPVHRRHGPAVGPRRSGGAAGGPAAAAHPVGPDRLQLPGRASGVLRTLRPLGPVGGSVGP
jgi:MoxR-like ATPase